MRRRILQSTLLVVTITALVLGVPLAITTWRLMEDFTRADLLDRLEQVATRLDGPGSFDTVDQEDLRLASVIAYGNAQMKRTEARAWHRELRRTARSMERFRPKQALTDLPPEEAIHRLAALGIPIQYVPAKPAEESP